MGPAGRPGASRHRVRPPGSPRARRGRRDSSRRSACRGRSPRDVWCLSAASDRTPDHEDTTPPEARPARSLALATSAITVSLRARSANWSRVARREYLPTEAMSEKQQWIQEDGVKSGRNLNEVVAVAGLAALLVGIVGIVLVFAEPSRRAVGELPTAPSPTFSRNDSGTPLPTEAEAWGGIWAQAHGVAVLRPTWLPTSKDEYQIYPAVGTSPD